MFLQKISLNLEIHHCVEVCIAFKFTLTFLPLGDLTCMSIISYNWLHKLCLLGPIVLLLLCGHPKYFSALCVSLSQYTFLLYRLDSKDENRGHRVLGYLIYFDGVLKATVEGALAAQAEIHSIDSDMEISVQVWYVSSIELRTLH